MNQHVKANQPRLLYPEPKIKTQKPIRLRNIIVYQKNNTYALLQRQTRFLSGLWGFYESEELPDGQLRYLGEIIQHYSHFTLQATIFLSEEAVALEGYEWFSLDEIAPLSLSRADHKVIAKISQDQKKYHH